MSDENVIKDYLVGLGFKVDQASLNKLKESLKKVGSEVKDTSARISSDSKWSSSGFSQAAEGFKTAAQTIAAAFTSVTIATVKLFDKTAQADLGYQKFALKMYMAKDVAKEFKIVTDAMGESFDDIAWIPELTQRYRSLMTTAHQLALPKDADAQFKYLRSIRGEFDRLKVEATYGLQWVSYSLFKHLQTPIIKVKEGFVSLNEYIIKNMPEIAEKISKWIGEVLLKAYDFGVFLKKFYEDMKKLHGELPEWAQSWGTWGAAIGLLFLASGPVGKALIALGTATAAMKDFYDYMAGKESSPELAPVWKFFLEQMFGLEAAIMLVKFAWEALVETITEELELPNWLKNIKKEMEDSGLGEFIKQIKRVSEANKKYEEAQKPIEKQRMTVDALRAANIPESEWGEYSSGIKEGTKPPPDHPVLSSKKPKKKSILEKMDEWRKDRLKGRTIEEAMKDSSISSGREHGFDYGDEGSISDQEPGYDAYIKAAAKKYRLEEATIKAIIKAESDFVERAISPKGAQGLMQLMPMHTKGMEDPYEPGENIMRGSKFYRDLLDKYKSEKKALAAYNAGETAVDKYKGIPPYKETQDYVDKVLKFRERYRRGTTVEDLSKILPDPLIDTRRRSPGFSDSSDDTRRRSPGFSDYSSHQTSAEGSVVTNNNNITIHLVGQTNEEQERRIEQIVKRASSGENVLMLRTAGVAA